MQYVPKPIAIDAFPMTVQSLGQEAIWPDWIDELVKSGRLRFTTSTADQCVAQLDTIGGTWDIAADDMIARFPEGVVVPYPADLMALIFQPVSVAQASEPGSVTQSTGAASTTTHGAGPDA